MLMMVVMMTILSSEPLLSMVIRECGGCCQHSSLTPWVSLLLCTLSPQPAPEPPLTHSWAVLRLLEPLLVCANVVLEVPGNLWLVWQSWFWGQPWGLTHTVSIPSFRMEPLCPSPPLPKSLLLYFQGISAHRLDLTSREAGSQEDLPEGKEPAWGLSWGRAWQGTWLIKVPPNACGINGWKSDWPGLQPCPRGNRFKCSPREHSGLKHLPARCLWGCAPGGPWFWEALPSRGSSMGTSMYPCHHPKHVGRSSLFFFLCHKGISPRSEISAKSPSNFDLHLSLLVVQMQIMIWWDRVDLWVYYFEQASLLAYEPYLA